MTNIESKMRAAFLPGNSTVEMKEIEFQLLALGRCWFVQNRLRFVVVIFGQFTVNI